MKESEEKKDLFQPPALSLSFSSSQSSTFPHISFLSRIITAHVLGLRSYATNLIRDLSSFPTLVLSDRCVVTLLNPYISGASRKGILRVSLSFEKGEGLREWLSLSLSLLQNRVFMRYFASVHLICEMAPISSF
jgi:hypothetical protein